MALTNLSQITTSGIATGTDLNIRNITGAAATFTGNVTVGGTLTYDDVTNIDSVGLVTARSGISVTGGDVNLTSGNLALASATPMVVASNGSGHLRLGAGGSEKVRIKSDGNVGIGTDNPLNKLDVRSGISVYSPNGSVRYQLGVDNSNGVSLLSKNAAGSYNTYQIDANTFAVRTTSTNSPVEKLRIASDGKVGVGINSPARLLHLHESNSNEALITFTTPTTGATSSDGFRVGMNGSEEALVWNNESGIIKFGTANTERLRLTSGGDIETIGNNGQSFKFNSNLGVGARNIQIWNSQQQPWHSFVGTNLEWNGTNYVKPSDNSNTNWGNTAGIVFEGATAGNTPAIRFLVDTPGENGTDYSLGSTKSTAIDNKTVACIAASGNVGIGTENPDTQLQVFGSSTTGNLKIGGGNGAGNHRVFISCTETNSYIDSYGNNAYGKLRINAAPLLLNDAGGGSVGIGTTNPSETLTLNHANGASIGLEYDGTENGTINVNSAAMYARAGSGKHLILGGNATEALRLKSDGKAYFTSNLGIGGQTSPGANIHINDFANSGYELKLTGNALQFNRTSNSYIDQLNDTGSILFRMGSSYTEAMRITSTGDIGINCAPYSNAGINLHIHGDNTTSEIRLTNTTTGTGANGGILQQSGNTLYLSNTENGNTVFETNGSEKVRITSDGQVQVSNGANGNDAAVNIYKSSGDNSDKAILRVGYNAAAAFEIYRTRSNGTIYMGPNQSGSDLIFQNVPTGGSTTERLRIEENGNVRVQAGSLYVKKGNSAIQLSEYNNGATIWLDGADGDFSGGDYFNISANDNQQLTFGYSGTEHIKLNTSGMMHFGGYPTNPTVATNSPIKVRSGAGAWGISIGMRSSQNDYAYIGFTDMNGTENIGDIFMQRTGSNTGHMVFSTNNGSGGSENRLRIGNSGRVCVSPDASFAAESTNIAMTIVSSGGDVGGYPGIHLRSTDSGGGTNSQNGMSVISTDGNWSLYSNAGSVHGLGLFSGNSANSSNCGFYLRSDKKITMGPETSNEAHSTNTCGQAVHIAGGSLGLGALSNYSAQSGTGGRDVRGWYHANAFTNRGSNTTLHLVTSLWGGGSPSGNSMHMMGGFRIHGYRYNNPGVSEEIIYFHNWNGGLPNYTRYHYGNWDPGNSVYVGSGGYVTIKLVAGNYYGYIIDLMTFNWYPVRDIYVTSTTFNTGTNL